MRIALLVGGALMAVTACGNEGRKRAEARTFLKLYEAADYRASIPERTRKVEQLEQLTISDPDVRSARESCVGAHRALIAAEQQNEVAARQLDQALAQKPGGEPLAVEESVRIRGQIEQAERSLTDARGRFQRCEEQTRSLALRFGER